MAGVPDREVHHGVQLVSPAAVVGEAFQVDHQDARQRPQVKLLGGLLVFLTGGTVPVWTGRLLHGWSNTGITLKNQNCYGITITSTVRVSVVSIF